MTQTRRIDSRQSSQDIEEKQVRKETARAKKETKRGKLSAIADRLRFAADKIGHKPLTEATPYYAEPSYLHHNGKVSTTVQLYHRPGSNRHMDYADVIDIIPTSPNTGVEMFFSVTDTVITGDEKKKLIMTNTVQNKNALDDVEKNGEVQDKDNSSMRHMRACDREDYDEYESIIDSSDPIVVFRITLTIVGPTREALEQQLEQLNKLLDQRHEGLMWDSIGGDQFQRAVDLYGPLRVDKHSMTSTAANYAGLNFSVNAGLNDEKGLPVGIDARALSATSAFFDMEGSLERQAVIAIPRSIAMTRYMRQDSTSHPAVASIMAQYAANQVVLRGHRVHHLVLNDFNYLERGLYYRPINNTEDVFSSYDVSQLTINPLQGFGKINDVVEIYNRLTNKIVNIFDVLNNLELTQGERGIILDVVQRFYMHAHLWREDAAQHPKRTRIVEISNPATYPTMGTMINEFTTLSNMAMAQNKELRSDRIDTLESILRQSISANQGILGRTTTITPTKAAQVYYNFNNIASPQLRQVQFLNILEYINYT
ncbi:hypothetical protein, partial [Corynebacterium mastitidis]|uniref:hypothetical protein n=1 Tax=Corynebacterium mastitidis TaxID=161890 RepID=UPI0012E9FFE7